MNRSDPRRSYAAWVADHQRPEMLGLLSRLARPGLLSFAHVLPAPELFPTARFEAALSESLSDVGVLQYRLPSTRLKRRIVELMALRGVECSEDQVFLTAGAQHALSLIASVLMDDGSSLVLDSHLYDGISVVTRPFRPTLLTAPNESTRGTDVERVASHLTGRSRPRFIYVIPDGHNPTGSSLPMDSRRRLVELARSHGVPIVEDDPYGLLGFGGGFPPPLRSLAPDDVLYVGSFSKILAPSLRLGWIVAPADFLPRLSTARQASDMDVASFTQSALALLLEGMDVEAYLRRLREEYERRVDAMTTALEEHFPPGARWTRPGGGLCMWVELPDGVDTAQLLHVALEREGVGFIPGRAFAMDPARPAHNCLRLALGTLPPDRIVEGVRRQGRSVRSGFDGN